MKNILLIAMIVFSVFFYGCGAKSRASSILDDYLESWQFGSYSSFFKYGGNTYFVSNEKSIFVLVGYKINKARELPTGGYLFKVNYSFKTDGGYIRVVPGEAIVNEKDKTIKIYITSD